MAVTHSIIMICYNQEEYIKVALDSVLCEEVKPDEIIVGDDASTDGTQRILEEYRVRYPEIIKLVFNKNNMGIFANLTNVSPNATGDMIHFLSGDDWYKPGLLQNMNKTIHELGLDPKITRFILLPHVVLHYLDGSEVLIKNDPKELEKYSPVGAVLRDVVHTRQIGFSRALFNMWPLFSEDSEIIGPWADRVQHVMFAQHIDKQIVMDCEGAVYRVGVGVASKTRREALERSYYNALVKIHSNYSHGELALSLVDLKYLELHKQARELVVNYSAASIASLLRLSISLAKTDRTEIVQIAREIYRTLRCLVSSLIHESS